MPNNWVCKAAEGTKYFLFLQKNACIINVWAKTLWVQDYFKLQVFLPIIRAVLGYSTQVTHKHLLWNMLVLPNILTLQTTVVSLVYSCLSFHKVKHNFLISLSKSQHFLSTSFYPMLSAFQATTSNCLPSLQRRHDCWLLIILAAFSPQISILHLLFQSLLFQYSFCYFSFYNLLDFLDLLLQFI